MGGYGVSGGKVSFSSPCFRRGLIGGCSTSSQVIYSRLSDIFGRKILLVIAITVFTVGNLLCGFSRNMTELIAFRVIAGLGGGGIGVLCLIIVADISTLRTRGKVS
jgi:MFS family permease